MDLPLIPMHLAEIPNLALWHKYSWIGMVFLSLSLSAVYWLILLNKRAELRSWENEFPGTLRGSIDVIDLHRLKKVNVRSARNSAILFLILAFVSPILGLWIPFIALLALVVMLFL